MRPPGTWIEGVFTVDGDPFVVVPLTVVTDSLERIAHVIPAGTTYLRRARPDGALLPRVLTVPELRAMETRLTEATWKRNALVVVDPASAHSIRAWWTPEWVFGGWYVNLQAPLKRTPHGFQTEDHFLDILVRPDRSWSWKDEDELELAVERGRVTAPEADAIRAEGERVVERIEAGTFPFDGSLEAWRPDPGWGVPVLRDEWLDRA